MNLYEHQKKALEVTKGFHRYAYYLDMGLGKTFVGSEKMAQLGLKNNLAEESTRSYSHSASCWGGMVVYL